MTQWELFFPVDIEVDCPANEMGVFPVLHIILRSSSEVFIFNDDFEVFWSIFRRILHAGFSWVFIRFSSESALKKKKDWMGNGQQKILENSKEN